MVVDPGLSLIDLLFHALKQLSFVSVGDVVETVEMNELGLAELGRGRSFSDKLRHVLLHLFEFWHFNQNLMHLLV